MTKRSRISRHLRAAVQKLNDRGLHLASKWACEQLVGMDYEESSVDDDSARTSWKALSNDSEITEKEQDLLLFARSLLTNGEYQRCAHLLRRSTSSTNNGTEAHAHDSATSSSNAVITHAASKLLSNSSVKSCLGVFLSVYSMYMAGEKLKEQLQTTDNVNNGTIFPGMIGSGTSVNEKQSSDGQSGEAKTVKAISANMKNSNFDGDHKKNPFLYELYAELEPLYYDKQMDGFLLYIFAVIVRDLVRQGQIQGQGGALGLTLFPKHPIKNPMHPDTGRFQGLDDNSSSMGLSAYALFAESLQEYPWNWSCWLELSELCVTGKHSPPSWQQIDPTKSVYRTVESKHGNGNENRDENKIKTRISNLNLMNNESENLKDGNDARICYLCFLTHYYLELQQGENAIKILEGVLQVFPNSLIATSQVALSHYCMRDYEQAQSVFEKAREADPHRIEHLDAYSNILYVRERRAELSYLAHSALRLAPHTPETCCVVGNYYSLKGKHERAILYFQRALKLNPMCLSAWTLMGHECVELRNTAAAVQCYRKAVDVSSGGDYRAWYGLGQTYEMLHMYQYALYYYKSAAALRPSDGRMWCAVGNCLCRLGTKTEATKAFERAVAAGDREGVATRELARLYRDNGAVDKAAECYYHHLLLTGGGALVTAVQKVILEASTGHAAGTALHSAEEDSGGHMDALISGVDEVVNAERAEALLYLASYYKEQGFLTQAELLCSRLMDKVGSEGDEARAMMREIRTLSLQPAGSTMSAMSATIRTGDAPMSAIGIKFRSQLHTTFSQQPQSNSTYTYRGTASSSIDGSSYRDGSGSGSRSLFEEKDSANESKSNFLDLERSLDDSHYDARRAEGDLSMSIGSNEEEDVDLGPRHTNYRTP